MTLADCVVCRKRHGTFLSGKLCAACRVGVAKVILTRTPEEIVSIWRVAEGFEETRQRLLFHEVRSVEPQVMASVASGLWAQGLADDGLILAAIAIELGEASDLNSVGASALGVVFDPSLLMPDVLDRLRALVDT
jgi:hypothetical protein